MRSQGRELGRSERRRDWRLGSPLSFNVGQVIGPSFPTSRSGCELSATLAMDRGVFGVLSRGPCRCLCYLCSLLWLPS
jgi:hypothetical protein